MPKTLNLDNIQGNVVGAFNKDFQSFLFLKFKSKATGRAWIKEIADGGNDVGVATSSSSAVLRFNAQFKALTAQGIKPETVIGASWTHLALSFAGLQTLGLKTSDLSKFPQAFKDGMGTRNTVIGDVGPSDPSLWLAPFNTPGLHAVLIVASDSEADLLSRVAEIKGTAAFGAGITVVAQPVEGRTRQDQGPTQVGHEHFGFKDGVSQPGLRGINSPDDPITNPDQGHPGQDLLWPGEFVLGYPTQKKKAKPGHDGPNPDPGALSKSGPAWTEDGSYLSFRRLAQDVAGFQQQLQKLATAQGLHIDLMGAKLVGRYKTGCPLEIRKFQTAPVSPTDPGLTDPALADSDTLNNNFEFGDDPQGATCPLAAHIRKAYPRDEQTLPNAIDSESDTQTHRLLRRGIPFGGSFNAPKGGGANDPRGLLFLAYQTDLERQFEFVQSKWVNNANFPPFPKGSQPGEDPIISQSGQGPFELSPGKPTIAVSHFVTTTGGEYFFAPSISTLQKIGAGSI